MENKAIKNLKIIWNKTKFKIFNNHLSLTTNVLHEINHSLSQIKYSKTLNNYKKNDKNIKTSLIYN